MITISFIARPLFLGAILALLFAVGIAFCVPVEPEAVNVWNWDQLTRYHDRGAH